MEILVVLAILGAASALAAPGLAAGLDAASRQATRLDLEAQLQALRREAFNRGQSVLVEGPTVGGQERSEPAATAPAPGSAPGPSSRTVRGSGVRPLPTVQLNLPVGQSVSFETPLTIAADGECSGSRLLLYRNDKVIATFDLERDGCRLHIAS